MKKHGIVIVIIVLGTILSWYKVLGQSLMGEGFYYLFHGLGYGSFWGTFLDMLRSYEAGAKLLFDFFRIFFKDNIFLYQLFLLISLSVINVLFYVFVFVLTQKRLIASLSGILLSVNFVGFEMFAIGNYQFFAQRTLAFLLLFPSITLFVLYLRGNKFIHYLTSVFLYCLSFFLFHFTLFVTPYYLCIYAMFMKTKRSIVRGILLSLPFILIPVIILRYGNDPVSKDITVMMFVNQFRWQIPAVMMKHFSILTIPEAVLSYFGKMWNMPHGEVALRLFYPITMVYGISLFTLYRINKKLFPIALWSLVFLVPTFFIGLYTRWDMTNNLGSGSRYLYVPTIAFAIYWGVVLSTVGKKYLGVFGLLIIAGLWSILQSISIARGFAIEEEKHVAMKTSMQYVKTLSRKLASDAIIIVPSPMGYYGAYFAQLFYVREHTSYAPFFSDWANELPRPFDPLRDYILEYDQEQNRVVDKTHEYKAMINQRTSVQSK